MRREKEVSQSKESFPFSFYYSYTNSALLKIQPLRAFGWDQMYFQVQQRTIKTSLLTSEVTPQPGPLLLCRRCSVRVVDAHASDGRERRIKQKRGQSGERTPWSSNNILGCFRLLFFFYQTPQSRSPRIGCWTKNTISSEVDPFMHHAAPSLRRDCHTQLINITPRKDQTMHFWWFFFFFLTWIHIRVITFPPRQQTPSVSLHVRASEEAMRSNHLLIAEEHLKAMGFGAANY